MLLKQQRLFLAGLLLIVAFCLSLAKIKPIQTQAPVATAVSKLLHKKALLIPTQAGIWHLQNEEQSFLALLGLREIGKQQINLCQQLTNPKNKTGNILPIIGGMQWDVLQAGINQRLAAGKVAHYELRNILLDDASFDIPAFAIQGSPVSNSLQLTIKSPVQQYVATELSYPSLIQPKLKQQIEFSKEAWLFWQNKEDSPAHAEWLGDRALQFRWLDTPYCDLGVLQIKVYVTDAATLAKQAHWPLYRMPDLAVGERQFQRTSIAAGTTEISPQTRPKTEDGALFTRLLNKGLIFLTEQQEILYAPRDLARIKSIDPAYWTEKKTATAFADIKWDQQAQTAHADFYGQQAGPYVRAQIKRFNQERMMTALRIKAVNRQAQTLISKSTLPWQATVAEQTLTLTEQMPLHASSLFKQLPQHWQPWQRVADWPRQLKAPIKISFNTHFATAAKGRERFELMLLGQQINITGANIIKSESRCISHRCNPQHALARWVLIELKRGTKTLIIEQQPQPAKRLKKLYRSEFRHIILDKQAHLSWRYNTGRGIRRKPVDVMIVDRNAEPLWQQGALQAAAQQAGLAALVGVSYQHESSLAGMFARLPVAQVDAQLSLDLYLQGLAQTALVQGVKRVSARYQGNDMFQSERNAALIVMDADSGEILALAGTPVLTGDTNWQDVLGFDAMKTAQSPLRVRALQHLGNNHSRPGSTFKLVTSLTLEQQAQTKPIIETLLSGVNRQQLNQLGSQNGYSFTAEAGCYPAKYEDYSKNCLWGKQRGGKDKDKAVINNFGRAYPNGRIKFFETPIREMQSHHEKRYGLEQGLRDSLNTWYVWLYEMIDATLLAQGDIAGLPDTRALVPTALDQVRPINAILHHLGFGQALDLSGGLLPADYQWQVWDVLKSSASLAEPVKDRHNLRLMSIGLRHYVTPLNMALVSASIASGHWVRPILLKQLNQQQAEPAEFLPLAINTDRIQAGMKRVPQDGSAKNAFKGKANAWLRQYLYAKTGTAPVEIKRHNKTTNTAWLTGWLDKGAIANKNRRLAFACQVSHSRDTGGASCGPIMQQFFSALKQPRQVKVQVKPRELGL